MIRTPAFWRTDGLTSRLLAPAGAVYGFFSARRMRQPPRHVAPVPVIAIGNFTAGGAGKTPTAIAIARLVTGHGYSPVIVMRGYGGTLAGPHIVDAVNDSAAEVGDEALMIARIGLPVVVARDRALGADYAVARGGDLLILDDGFQSPALARDLALVVVDDGFGIGNGRVLPAGPLRAPLVAQMPAADAIIVISNGAPRPEADAVIVAARQAGRPVFAADLRPDARTLVLDDREIVAFAGIGRPDKLAEGLKARGAIIRELVPFPDHHRYSGEDARALLARLDAGTRLVTTAKDMARMMGDPDASVSALAARTEVADVELVFREADALAALLEARLKPRR